MSKMHSEALKAALIDSELDYFRAGAMTVPCLGGEFCHVNGYEGLAAACVHHGVESGKIGSNPNEWLESLKKRFSAAGAQQVRFYCIDASESLEEILQQEGYLKNSEFGLVAKISNIPDVQLRKGSKFVLIESDQNRQDRKLLYWDAVTGADGYCMQDGQFAEFEQLKQDTGYMVSFLLYLGEKPVGAVSLAIKKDFARLKNLLVHPDYRGQGLGKSMVQLLTREAKLRGACYLGTYADEENTGYKLYQSCGLRELTRQTGWYKSLSG